jgi:hypothetical protein
MNFPQRVNTTIYIHKKVNKNFPQRVNFDFSDGVSTIGKVK